MAAERSLINRPMEKNRTHQKSKIRRKKMFKIHKAMDNL